MANKTLFRSSLPGAYVPPTDTTNLAGGAAYGFTPQQALAQLAATGCFGATYYAAADMQLSQVLATAKECDPDFVAACAVYARRKGLMKDMPAVLLAHLAARSKTDPRAFVSLRAAWPYVVDNGKMLRNFVQVVRSGVTGRKSMGTAVKRLVQKWLEDKAQHAPSALFRDSVGNNPSLSDVIRMAHPKPADDIQRSLYAYLIGKPVDAEMLARLPDLVIEYELYKQSKHVMSGGGLPRRKVPNVPFQMLDSLGLDKEGWTEVARNAPWQMTRMNLNTFMRHGVLDDFPMVEQIANRLKDPTLVEKSKVFPYQLLTAYQNLTPGMPNDISLALQDALELATHNVQPFAGNVVVALDVSGSMRTPVTGLRKGATSKATCVEVAALIAATMFRVMPRCTILPYDTAVHIPRAGVFNSRDSVMTVTGILAKFGGGGTASQLPLIYLNEKMVEDVDLVLYVSDNESWMSEHHTSHNGTVMVQQWEQFKTRNPKAKLVCIDLTPNVTTQAPTRTDVLNVGGFSDAVFEVIASFMEGAGPDHWVMTIENSQAWPAVAPLDNDERAVDEGPQSS